MRSFIIGTVLALATLVAVPAMAGQKGEHANFPMPAAAFKAKVDQREAKAREHMEKRAATLSAADATALRSKFNDAEAKINAEVTKATADGTVTKDEAKAVHGVIHQVRPGHGGHHGEKKKGA